MSRVWMLWVALGALAVLRPELYLYVRRFLAALVRLFAPKPHLFFALVATAVLLTRLAMVPFTGLPRPVIHDEFAYLLQADTFAHGRLTNPSPKHPEFFEAEQVLVTPTYNGKYFPAQPIVMALGQVVFGHPWFGVWLSCGLMAWSLLWALSWWLPFRWVILSTALIYPLSTFSQWMNSYWGGSVTAIGGALAVGALARGNGWLFGLGGAILLLSRPYDALSVIIPVGIFFLFRHLKQLIPAAAVISLTMAWFAYYNAAVTGHPLRTPYAEWTSQYAVVPALTVLPPLPPKTFRHEILKMNYGGWEVERFDRAKTLEFFSKYRPLEFYELGMSFLGDAVALGLLLCAMPWLFRYRRARLFLFVACLWMAGSLIVYACFPHYAAPATLAILALSIASFRLLLLLRWPHRHTGRMLAYGVPLLLLLIASAKPAWYMLRRNSPYDGRPPVAQHDRVQTTLLDADLGPHIVFVHYSKYLIPHEEWVYNSANIAAQEIIWAHDMGPEKNRTLMQDFPGRKYWTFDPDQSLDLFTRISP